MYRYFFALILGSCLTVSSVPACLAAGNAVADGSTHVAVMNMQPGQHDEAHIKNWLNKIKPAAGVRNGDMNTSGRTPYWTKTVNRRSRLK